MKVTQDNVTLFSNALTEIYTLNSETSFTNRLALPVDLGSSSDLEFGLTEIMYRPPQRTIVQGAIIDVVSDVNVLIYCNLVTSQLVRSDISRLLGTIICPSQLGKHVFSDIYYLPVEFKTFWSIHINMKISNQTKPIVYFSVNNTTIPTEVVLHFRRTNGNSYHLEMTSLVHSM